MILDISFCKYTGLGNDFILIDNREQAELVLTPNQVVQWCNRHFGIGADGVIFVLSAQDNGQIPTRIFNANGSEAEMCGNGIRCLARFLSDLEGYSEVTYEFQTLAGVISTKVRNNELVTVNMGKPRILAREVPTTLVDPDKEAINVPIDIDGQSYMITCVSMGPPHCVTFVSNVSEVDLEELGPKFEYHPAFPKYTNINFVEIVKEDYLKMRVWERGVGVTLACGTGACASVVAGVLTGQSKRCATVELPGGCLEIEWSRDDNNLLMTGSAQKIFEGRVKNLTFI